LRLFLRPVASTFRRVIPLFTARRTSEVDRHFFPTRELMFSSPLFSLLSVFVVFSIQTSPVGFLDPPSVDLFFFFGDIPGNLLKKTCHFPQVLPVLMSYLHLSRANFFQILDLFFRRLPGAWLLPPHAQASFESPEGG